MDTEAVGRALLILGAVIVVVGLGVLLLAKVGFAGLPGDISIRRPGFIFHFPVVTMILVSVVLTIVLNVLIRIANR